MGQTELTAKWRQTHKQSRLTAGGDLGGGGMEPKRKRTHGHGEQCGDCGSGGGRGYKVDKW